MEISQITVFFHAVCVNFQQFYVLSKHFLSLKRRWPLFRSTRNKIAFGLLLMTAGRPAPGHAQLLIFYQSTRSLALAGAETCLTGTDDANPAGSLASQPHSISATCTLPFGMKDLAVKRVSSHFNQSRTGLTLSVSHMGFSSYQEGMLSLSCSRKISSRFHLGLAMRYNWIRINRYGSNSSLFLDAGAVLFLSRTLCCGAVGKNPWQEQMGAWQEAAPQTWQLGFSWTPVAVAAIHLDGYQEAPFPLRLRIGVEMTCRKILVLRWGHATAPSNLGFGLAVQQNKWRLDYGCLEHADLGLTHSTSFTMFW